MSSFSEPSGSAQDTRGRDVHHDPYYDSYNDAYDDGGAMSSQAGPSTFASQPPPPQQQQQYQHQQQQAMSHPLQQGGDYSTEQHTPYSDYPPGTTSLPYGDDEYADEEPFDINAIDPALRLRTTRTAHSVIAESIRSENVRRKKSIFAGLKRRGTGAGGTFGFRKNRRGSQPEDGGLPTIAGSEAGDDTPAARPISLPASVAPTPSTTFDEPTKGKTPLPRRTVYVNLPLPMDQVDKSGEPRVRYARNKVRTSKYTIITFLPRNLFEQFHRVANIYFLGLVILQLFPMFGAATPQIAMLPLVAILGMTAIKDAVEDWRRATLDEEVNTSAATKLGNWKNVNQPADPRNWFERLFQLGPSKSWRPPSHKHTTTPISAR